MGKNIKYSEKAFLTQLSKILRANKITKKEFAEGIGIAPQTVHKWYSTKIKPDWAKYMYRTIRFLCLRIKGFEPLQLFDMQFDENELNRHSNIVKQLENKAEKLETKIKDLEVSYELKKSFLRGVSNRSTYILKKPFEYRVRQLEEIKNTLSKEDYLRRKHIISNEMYSTFIDAIDDSHK